jgi:AraC-like DNA-binding protein
MASFHSVAPDRSISLFVKNILIFEELQSKQKTKLPFFADGFPGILFHDSTGGLIVSPHNKKMPFLFLYGQTIKPVELIVDGRYTIIVFQLYPFVLKSLFQVDPQSLNDDCYDLSLLKNRIGIETDKQLHALQDLNSRIKIITSLLKSLFVNRQEELDLPVAHAIQSIIEKKGKLTIKEVYNNLHLTERTFERRFYRAVGVTAKQFSKMIQFQQSLEQFNVNDYNKLTDIVYANGFADQSHFIRVFKAFTGKTPFAFRLQK